MGVGGVARTMDRFYRTGVCYSSFEVHYFLKRQGSGLQVALEWRRQEVCGERRFRKIPVDILHSEKKLRVVVCGGNKCLLQGCGKV